jgi:hypothetical protein
MLRAMGVRLMRAALLALSGVLGAGCGSEPGDASGAAGAGGSGGSGGSGGGGADALYEPRGAPPALCRLELDCPAEIPDEPKLDCTFSVHDAAGATVYDSHAGLERRGRSSQSYPKRNYALELRDASGAEQPTDLLGMGGESDWVLDGSWVDRSFLRNDLAFTLYRNLEPGVRWAPRARFCELALNGEAQGIYRLGERIKRDDDRIDLPDDDGSGASFVIKQDSDGALRWDVGEQSSWKLVYPRQEDATQAQRDGVQAFLDALDTALGDPDPSRPDHDPLTLLDLDAVVDFVIVQELAKSADAYNLSLHLFKAPGAPAELVPWDFDLSMGQPISSIRPGNELSSLWALHRTKLSDGLEALPAFRERLAERWHAHRQGPLREEAVLAVVDHLLATLTPAALDANFGQWPIGDVDFQFIYAPYTLPEATSHPDDVARLRQWLHERLLWIDAHVAAYPED